MGSGLWWKEGIGREELPYSILYSSLRAHLYLVSWDWDQTAVPVYPL